MALQSEEVSRKLPKATLDALQRSSERFESGAKVRAADTSHVDDLLIEIDRSKTDFGLQAVCGTGATPRRPR